MLGLKVSPRIALVVAHDLVATAAAIVASFYIRFEAAGVAERLQTLFLFLPGFFVYAGVSYTLFHLYESKWRFASLPDLMNIVPRGNGAGGIVVGARLCTGCAQCARAVLLRQDHDCALLDPADRLPERIAHGVSLFPLHPHQAPRALAGVRIRRSCSVARPMPRCCCARSKAARSLRSGRSASSRRPPPIRGRAFAAFPFSAASMTLDRVVNDLAQRGTTIARVIFTPSAFEPEPSRKRR